MLRRRWCELIACVALVAGSAAAQSPAPAKACEAKEFRAFDFWIGEWRVTWKTPQGQPAEGRNSIRRIVDGCALEENWKGGDGSSGKSLTFFDPAAKRWHQTWIDNTAQPLFLGGNFEGESLVLKGKSGEGFKETFHRITWTPLSGGLRQHWEQSPDGKSWTTVFDGRYERAGGQ
jgi:hypothetical protein